MLYTTAVNVIESALRGQAADEGVAILVVRSPTPGQVENLRSFAWAFAEGDALLWSSVHIQPEVVRGSPEDVQVSFRINVATGETITDG